MMAVASEKQVAWTCVGYIVVGVFDKGLHLGRVQEGQSKIQWNIRHHKTLGAFLWWDLYLILFDDIWCIQAGQENRVGELNCNAGSHDRQFPFISTVNSLQKSYLHFPKIFKFENWAAWLKHVVAFQPTTVVVWTNLINLNESETWWSATDSMISFCTCPLTFSSGVFQGGRKGTHTTRYYELINKYAKDSYGGENDLGLRCKRHQKHSKTCSCLFGVMVQSGYFVGKMSMIQCGQLWAMRNYAWLWPPRELVLLSLH